MSSQISSPDLSFPNPERAGEIEQLTPLVRRVLAANPSFMTGPGTNTYVVGTDPVLILDPGPDREDHLEAVTRAVDGREVKAIMLTHDHGDHSLGCDMFRAHFEVPIYSKRDTAGKRPADRPFPNGAVMVVGGARLRGVHTPGHAAEHLCFLLEEEHALFTGDHVMAGSTVVIAPPNGNMADYLGSLRRLIKMDLSHLYPGHGGVLPDPSCEMEGIIAHREARESSVLSALQAGDTKIADIVARVYADVQEFLHPVARYTVLAHLQKLEEEGRVRSVPDPDIAAEPPRVVQVGNTELPLREPPEMKASFSFI